MITAEQALHWIENRSPAELERMTEERLLGHDTTPVGSGYFDEPPEDLVIVLLRQQDLDSQVRKAVLEGCRGVYSRLSNWLLSKDRDEGEYWREVAFRFGCVLDMAKPSELHGLGQCLLTLEKSMENPDTALLRSAVIGLMGYRKQRSEIPLWEDLLTYEAVAAYAFNALVDIDPYLPDIPRHLRTLWEKQIAEGWPVDTAFLMRRAARERRSRALIGHVLSSLRGREFWNRVETELERRPWSAAWTDSIPYTVEGLHSSNPHIRYFSYERKDHAVLIWRDNQRDAKSELLAYSQGMASRAQVPEVRHNNIISELSRMDSLHNDLPSAYNTGATLH